MSSMNWEKLRTPARATFKHPNFQSLSELGKLGSTTYAQDSQVPISNPQMNWEKLNPNLSFTAENKKGNLHKAGHISNLIWWTIYSLSSNFKNLSMN